MNEIIVGNIGTVYHGSDDARALEDFDAYVAISKCGHGRAAGEPVTWMRNGEIHAEYAGIMTES